MKLSKNLSLSEVTRSYTAKRLGIDNTVPQELFPPLLSIAKFVFQPLRDDVGVRIYISSGYRCEELNEAAGGSENSQHSLAEALDLDADVYGEVSNSEIFYYIKDYLEFDKLIWEYGDDDNPDWVHVSYREGRNRNRILRANRNSRGKTYYTRL
jgi:zinc D-Ala-D-Ala carboxypeptidase